MIRTLLRTPIPRYRDGGALSLPATGQKPKVFPDYTYVYEPSDSIQKTIFDHALYRAYYQKLYRDEPSDPRAYRWTQILQIGKSHQAFLDYGDLRRDSIWNAAARVGKAMENLRPILMQPLMTPFPSRRSSSTAPEG